MKINWYLLIVILGVCMFQGPSIYGIYEYGVKFGWPSAFKIVTAVLKVFLWFGISGAVLGFGYA